jgi:hypothetical protein
MLIRLILSDQLGIALMPSCPRLVLSYAQPTSQALGLESSMKDEWSPVPLSCIPTITTACRTSSIIVFPSFPVSVRVMPLSQCIQFVGIRIIYILSSSSNTYVCAVSSFAVRSQIFIDYDLLQTLSNLFHPKHLTSWSKSP